MVFNAMGVGPTIGNFSSELYQLLARSNIISPEDDGSNEAFVGASGTPLKWIGIYTALLFLFYTVSYPIVFRSKQLFYHAPKYQWVSCPCLWLFAATVIHIPSVAASFSFEAIAVMKLFLIISVPTYAAAFVQSSCTIS